MPVHFADAPSAADQPLFYDLDSVQVLKGPQGALFGRTSTGGAVLFGPRRPTDALEGYIVGKFGTLDLRSIQGAINVPILDDVLAARVSGLLVRRQGYTVSLDNGRHYNDQHRDSLRAQVRFSCASARRDRELLKEDCMPLDLSAYHVTDKFSGAPCIDLDQSPIRFATCTGASPGPTRGSRCTFPSPRPGRAGSFSA